MIRKKKERAEAAYAGIDLMKAILCFHILFLHSGAYAWTDGTPGSIWVNMATDLALSFFFCANGFFEFRGLELSSRESDRKIMRERWKKNGKRYIYWFLIYLPLMLYGEFAVYGSGPVTGILKIARAFFLTGWHYYDWTLWYMLALVTASAIIALLLAKGAGKTAVLVFFGLLYILGVWMDILYGMPDHPEIIELYYSLFYTTRNGIFFGGFFIAYGMWLSARGERTVPSSVLAAVLGVGMVCCFVFQNHAFLRMMFQTAVFLAFFEIMLKLRLPAGRIFSRLRKLSTVIYFVHMLYVALFALVLRRGAQQPDPLTICGVTACSLLTWILVESGERRKIRWLQGLF